MPPDWVETRWEMADRLTPDERRFRALASSSVERIAELDSQRPHRLREPEPRGERATTCSPRSTHVHPDDRRAVAAQFAAAFEQRRAAAHRVPGRRSAGATRWIESTITPFPAEDGERHVLVVSRDVTERRELEQRLRESRERFQLIAENAYDMIVEYDSEWRLQYSNDQVRAVLGFGEGARRRSTPRSSIPTIASA